MEQRMIQSGLEDERQCAQMKNARLEAMRRVLGVVLGRILTLEEVDKMVKEDSCGGMVYVHGEHISL